MQSAMAAQDSSLEAFCLFSATEDKTELGLSFLNSPEKALPPPPPCIEVLPSQGRVSTQEVFALSNSDMKVFKNFFAFPFHFLILVEFLLSCFYLDDFLCSFCVIGGLKLWEGSLDLVKYLRTEVEEGLSFAGKSVLELGCGHGLPGVFACLQGAAVLHFQDFNAEVLKCLTIPNVNANLSMKTRSLATHVMKRNNDAEICFFAGDWNDVHQILPSVYADENNPHSSTGVNLFVGYDIILMAETVYSISSLRTLYKLIKKCMARPHGVAYMAAKKHYFGVGGGSRRFLSLVEKDGLMGASLVAEVADGSSNVREVWKIHFK
ncbi:hypothetical protein RJ639_046428 [Escallonia herrerae]|uniref:protein-histidine N-methyltransferase n=1 Tax=Escallonia herrerae TaxID=1293975 RepID=A0AA88W7B7_9ASTE|nr:hypothetical protein RJ639_046428 [Escallonia herrerae]